RADPSPAPDHPDVRRRDVQRDEAAEAVEIVLVGAGHEDDVRPGADLDLAERVGEIGPEHARGVGESVGGGELLAVVQDGDAEAEAYTHLGQRDGDVPRADDEELVWRAVRLGEKADHARGEADGHGGRATGLEGAAGVGEGGIVEGGVAKGAAPRPGLVEEEATPCCGAVDRGHDGEGGAALESGEDGPCGRDGGDDVVIQHAAPTSLRKSSGVSTFAMTPAARTGASQTPSPV